MYDIKDAREIKRITATLTLWEDQAMPVCNAMQALEQGIVNASLRKDVWQALQSYELSPEVYAAAREAVSQLCGSKRRYRTHSDIIMPLAPTTWFYSYFKQCLQDLRERFVEPCLGEPASILALDQVLERSVNPGLVAWLMWASLIFGDLTEQYVEVKRYASLEQLVWEMLEDAVEQAVRRIERRPEAEPRDKSC
jgi:hypothetical protein